MQLAELVHDASAPHGLGELVGSPWCLDTESAMQLCSRYDKHRQGPKLDFKKNPEFVRTAPRTDYDVRDGVAVIPIPGLLAPKANMSTRMLRGTSLQSVGEQVNAAAADARVNAIVLSADSPGGSVLGTPELADTVYALAKKKPIVAHTAGRMAGAAYWISCAANAVIVSDTTVQVGSIAVLMRRPVDPPMGSQKPEFFFGHYERMHRSLARPDKDAEAYMQNRVDYLYAVFVEAVARARGVGVSHVNAHLADGRIFTGSQAIEAGLADDFMGLDALIADLAARPSAYAQRRRLSASRATHTPQKITLPRAL